MTNQAIANKPLVFTNHCIQNVTASSGSIYFYFYFFTADTTSQLPKGQSFSKFYDVYQMCRLIPNSLLCAAISLEGIYKCFSFMDLRLP